MAHDHSLNYYAVYCPITILVNAVSIRHYRKNNKTVGLHAIGSSSNMTSLDSIDNEKKSPSRRVSAKSNEIR